MIITRIGSAEARSKWRDLLDEVYSGATDVIIERNGKDVAVIIPTQDYEALQDELNELRSARLAGLAYEEWQRDSSLGRPWEEVELS